jgi:hypothetical protein
MRVIATPQQEAQEAPQEAVERPAATLSGEKVEPGVSIFEEVEGYPYSVKYFDLKGIWSKKELGFKDDFKAIDKAYRDGVEKGELQDDPKIFDKWIKQAIKATNSEMSPRETQVERVAKWLKFMGEL